MKSYTERFEELKEKFLNIGDFAYNELRQLQDEIKANGCGEIFRQYEDTNGKDFEVECDFRELCPTCQSLIKQIDEVLK